MSDAPDLCKICNQPINRYDVDYAWCSEFCANVTAENRIKFLSAKEGDFIDYPCADCGAHIQDEYVPGGYCSHSSCTAARAKRKLAVARELLNRCHAIGTGHLPVNLWEDINKFLEKK